MDSIGWLIHIVFYSAVSGTSNIIANDRRRQEIKRLEEILTLHLQQRGKQIERLETRLKAIEGPSNDNTSPPRDAEPSQTIEKPPPIPDQPTAQAKPGQSTSQTRVEKFFAAVLEKNRRQATGQWQDPQVDRAVRMVMEALNEHASDSELSRYIDVALDAMQHHAAGWDNYRKK